MSYRRIPTLIAQAAVGFMLGTFVVIIASILAVTNPYAVEYAFIIPFLWFWALVIGIPSGLAIWTCGHVTDRPLNRTFRCVIGVSVLALGWFAYAVLIS